MKALVIAGKDLTRSLRSPFAIVFMFGIPLLVTGLFYFMFGSMDAEKGFSLPRPGVVLVNLDAGDQAAGQLGKRIVEAFQSQQMAQLMDVSIAADPAAARASVDSGQAAAAVIIPAAFSASYTDAAAVAEIEFYADPGLSVGPALVRGALAQITDEFAGVKITVALALQQAEAGQIGYDQIARIASAYARVHTGAVANLLVEKAGSGAAPADNPLRTIVGPIMAGMMIFYAFFTGVYTASSILKEDEEQTLQRLFTTPTAQSSVLAGKFIAVGLTVLIQVSVLLAGARLIFNIQWGSLASVALAALAIVCAAAAFGVLICSFLKNSKQSGVAFGGILTVTGMVGMVDIFTGKANDPGFGILPLLTPQGWAARGILLSMNGASPAEILPYALTLLALSLAFFTIGVLRFQRRYA